MSGLKAFLAAHRAALLGLAGALAALTLFWAARSSRAAMDWWVESVSMPVKRALGAVCDPLPFSVCEAGATLLILGAVGLLVRAIWRAAHGQPAALGAFGLHLARQLCRKGGDGNCPGQRGPAGSSDPLLWPAGGSLRGQRPAGRGGPLCRQP